MKYLFMPVLFLLVAGTTSAQAMTIQKAEITHNGGRYYIYFDVIIEADKATVSKYMDDYMAWPQWSSVVQKVTVLEKIDDRSSLLELELNSCLFIFCRTLSKTEKVTRISDGHLVTLTTRGNADFRYAREIWKASAEGDRTRLVYDAVMEPDIFVLPFMRNWVISSRIRKELKRSIEQLEQLAHSVAP